MRVTWELITSHTVSHDFDDACGICLQILGSLVQSGRGDRLLIQKVAGELIRRLDDSSSLTIVDDIDRKTVGNKIQESSDAETHRNSYSHLNSLKGKVSTSAPPSYK